MSTQGAFYTKALGRMVAKGARPDKITKIHVISGKNDTWSVVIQGNFKAFRASLSKSEAISLAKEIAAKKAAEFVVVHDKSGNVMRRIPVKMPAPAS